MNPHQPPQAIHPRPDLLQAVDEDVLPADIAREVRSHLESCRICAQLRQDLLHPPLSEPSVRELIRLRSLAQPATGSRKFPARYLGIAAAAAALLVIGIWLPKREAVGPPPRIQLAKQAPSQSMLQLQPAPLRLPLSSAIIFRGQRDDSTERYLKDLGTALEPYRATRYPEAASKLESLAARYPRSVEPLFYLGVARLMTGLPQFAIEPLQKSLGIGGEALNDDIRWYLAIARERTGAWDQALPLLEALCQGEGPYHRAACDGKGSH